MSQDFAEFQVSKRKPRGRRVAREPKRLLKEGIVTPRFRWAPDGVELSMDAIGHYVDRVAQDLDPDSRYISELRNVLVSASDACDFLARLGDLERARLFRESPDRPSCGERGRAWLTGSIWERMNLFERTLANLVTSESRMMWETAGTDWSLLPSLLARLPEPREVLSVPCATGSEAYSIVIAALANRLEVSVSGVDRQPAVVEHARTGELLVGNGDENAELEEYVIRNRHTGLVHVSPAVLSRCHFIVGDVMIDDFPRHPFELVVCRNFLGYFRGEALRTAVTAVAARVAPTGLLLLDPFAINFHQTAHQILAVLADQRLRRLRPDACYFAAPDFVT
jgi:chemotaxis methyl-accepting protein methylase